MSDEEFYRLTPRQFAHLAERHREDLVHREMVGAFITAAVKNYSMRPPEPLASPLDYMLNHKAHKSPAHAQEEEMDEEQLEIMSEYNLRVAIGEAKLREEAKARKEKEQAENGRP